jgi:subtilisin family serine protease
MRVRNLIIGMSGLAALAVAGLLVLSSAAVATVQTANHRVIVVFKNQETSLPATRALESRRISAVHGIQAPVTSQLSASGAKQVQSYNVINAVSATVSASEESQLKSNPAVSEVIPDQVIQLATPQTTSSSTLTTGAPVSPLPGTCSSNPSKPQLEPQALELLHADSDNPNAHTARSLGINGAGVKVAFIADGLDTANADFIRQPSDTPVFNDYKDFTGFGTGQQTGGEESFGDASSIAAQGNQVYDISDYSSLPLNRNCYIRIEGVAPGASLYGMEAFTADEGFNSAILQAINYAVTVDHVNVLSESFGSNQTPDDAPSLNLIKQADDAAVAAGTVVTVSTGDAGVTSTIGSPATDPELISAGATTSYQIDAQDGYGGARFPGVTGYLNNNISSFSSGGFDSAGGTVDVVAPGELGWALCSTDTAMYGDCLSLAGNPTAFLAFGGTSESAPLTAGVAALVIQAYAKTHSGAVPTPGVVKQIITSTAHDIGAPADQQGSGEVNAYKAVLAAESYQTSATGETLLESSSQLNATAATGTPESLTDAITNNGAKTQTIALSTRTLGAYHTLKTASVTLSDTASSHAIDWQGINDNVESVTFHVPSGQNRLNAAIAFQNAFGSLSARVRLTLIDPNGKLAAYSVPQGDGNYGDVQVTDPAAGRWTAYIYSRDSADGGTTGPVVFSASSATYESFGRVTPSSVTLAPGASANVRLRVSTPWTPGDTSGAIVLSAGDSTTTVPVTLRSLIPVGRTSFSGTLTGGNGRGVNTGEAFYYQLNLPGGMPALNAEVQYADPGNLLSAWLIDPAGQAEAWSSNTQLGLPAFSATNEPGLQLHTLSPAAGTWTLIVDFIPAVSGTAISEPFTVSTNERSANASAPGLPDSAHRRLTAGQAYTYDVHIRNSGDVPEEYFIDARQPGSTTLDLASVGGSTTTDPLTLSSNIPVYLVPSDTTSWTATAATTGTEPIQFDSSSPAGDPDIGSTSGLTATASLSGNPVTPGEWSIAPLLTGAFGAAAQPSEPVTTSMTADAAPFDPSVSSTTGDLWLSSINASYFGSPAFVPVTVNPGASATIPVTITPSGPSGSTDSGTLYVDDMNAVLFAEFLAPNGNQVAALPYTYSVR